MLHSTLNSRLMSCYDMLVQRPLLCSRHPLHKLSCGTAAKIWSFLIPQHVPPLMPYVFLVLHSTHASSGTTSPVSCKYPMFLWIISFRSTRTFHEVTLPQSPFGKTPDTTSHSYSSLSNSGFGAVHGRHMQCFSPCPS